MQHIMNDNQKNNDINQICSAWKEAFEDASVLITPNEEFPKKRPWISERTINLISQRNDARREKDEHKEKRINRCIKKSVRQDKGE
eukprot:11962588-Karenia_brevis.AAC.1